MRDSNSLSARKIARLTKRGRYPDGRVPGLLFQISKTGGRSWVLRYCLNKRERMLGLGRAELVSVEYARDRARAAWRQILDGIDPVAVKQERKAGVAAPTASSITFAGAVDRYIASHRAGWKNAKHANQWQSTLNYAAPIIGSLLVDQIDTAQVMLVLEQEYEGKTLWTAIPETATRLRQRIEAVLDWAKARQFRDGENPARWRGHLDKLLPARAKIAKVAHHPALPYADLPALMAGLRTRRSVSAKALEFTILIACRTNEVTQARRSEIDWSAKVWTIPGDRMKAGREHRVPLCDRTIELLESLPCEADSDFLFIGGRAGMPMSNAAMAKLLKEIGPPSTAPGKIATVHGMRSTFRDWAAEMTNFPRELAEAALAHILDSKTEAAYQRGDLLLKRRKLMEAWARFCAAPIRRSDIVPMRRAVK